MAGKEILDRETLLKKYGSFPGEKQQNQATTDPVKKKKRRKKKKNKKKSNPNDEQVVQENIPQFSEQETKGQIPNSNSDSLVADRISNTNLIQGEEPTTEETIACTDRVSFSEGPFLNLNTATKTDLPVQNTYSPWNEGQTSNINTNTRPKITILGSDLTQQEEEEIRNTISAQRNAKYVNSDNPSLRDGGQFTSKNTNSSDIIRILNTNSTQGAVGQIFSTNLEQGCGRPFRTQKLSWIAEGETDKQASNTNSATRVDLHIPHPNKAPWDGTAITNAIYSQPKLYGEYKNMNNTSRDANTSALSNMHENKCLDTDAATISKLPNQNCRTTATTNLQDSYANSASSDGLETKITNTAARTKLHVPQASRAPWDVEDIPNTNLLLSELSEELNNTKNVSLDVNLNKTHNMTTRTAPWIKREIQNTNATIWSDEPISRANMNPWSIGQILSTNPTEAVAEENANINSSHVTEQQIQNTNATASWDESKIKNTDATMQDGRQFSSSVNDEQRFDVINYLRITEEHEEMYKKIQAELKEDGL